MRTLSRKLMKEIDFTLTEPQLIAKAKAAAEREDTLLELTKELKGIKESYKERMDVVKEDLHLLLNSIHEGKETRVIECLEIRNFAENWVRYLFEGEVVLERALSGEERQLEMEETHVPEQQVGGEA